MLRGFELARSFFDLNNCNDKWQCQDCKRSLYYIPKKITEKIGTVLHVFLNIYLCFLYIPNSHPFGKIINVIAYIRAGGIEHEKKIASVSFWNDFGFIACCL
jgi:hypothetical protein